MQTFEKLKELRESHNWTQEDVANKLALSTNGYAKIERGETRLTLERLEQFAEVFDVDISKLIQTEGSVFYQVNDSGYNQGHVYNTYNSEIELEKLQLEVKHKDQLLAQQAREIETLQLLVESLKQK